MKHSTTSRWHVAKTSQWYVSTTSLWNILTAPQVDGLTTSHQYASTMSQTSLKWNTQRRLSRAYPRRPISTSLQRLLQLPNQTPNNVAVERLPHVSELLCCDVLLVGFCYVFRLLCHDLHLVAFHASFKYQIKHQIFLVLTRREARGVVWIIN